jgi:hypothetical protein
MWLPGGAGTRSDGSSGTFEYTGPTVSPRMTSDS